ncbi:MAG: hypothetical protein QOC54_1, partial [Baekduia sp.]|nr:hypothetical protein [Baekduia sp.]
MRHAAPVTSQAAHVPLWIDLAA